MSKESRIIVLSFACLVWTSAAVATPLGGSSLVSRPFVDTSGGQVYINAGGFFQPGTQVDTFSLFTGDFVDEVTPILFELTSPGVHKVRGVGTGDLVSASALTQSFAFGLQYGSATAATGNYTFGFINAFVNTIGAQTSSSPGVVAFNTPVARGTGAGTTNDWVFTPTLSNISIPLGTTFGLPGQVASWTLNNPALSIWDVNRTYSATVDAPEPGSFTLACVGAMLIGAAFVTRRYRSKVWQLTPLP